MMRFNPVFKLVNEISERHCPPVHNYIVPVIQKGFGDNLVSIGFIYPKREVFKVKKSCACPNYKNGRKNYIIGHI
tara:strand:+ start:3231 stop:3455 length:225 start_codon:yes stop_codon:yes gene_type:complete